MGYMHLNNLYKYRDVLLFKEVWAMEKVHGCLKYGSTIHMADGSLKEIQHIMPGEYVLSFDTKTNEFVSKKVLDTPIQPITEALDWYEFELENGKTITCTEDHPILTTVGWVCAKDITEKYEIVSI